jgi:hypothetical protein
MQRVRASVPAWVRVWVQVWAVCASVSGYDTGQWGSLIRSATLSEQQQGSSWLTVESGAVPKSLTGTFLKCGPALFNKGNTHVHSWLDGDGCVEGAEHTRTHAYNMRNSRTSEYKYTYGVKCAAPALRYIIQKWSSVWRRQDGRNRVLEG